MLFIGYFEVKIKSNVNFFTIFIPVTVQFNSIPIIKSEKSIIQVIDNTIFHIQYKEGFVLEPADFKANLELYKDWSMGIGKKVLHDFLPYSSASSEARKFAGTIEIEVEAEAFVFTNLAQQRLLVKFHLLTTKNNHPMRVFSTKENAIKWLKSF